LGLCSLKQPYAIKNEFNKAVTKDQKEKEEKRRWPGMVIHKQVII
jgi:hypothetical protein